MKRISYILFASFLVLSICRNTAQAQTASPIQGDSVLCIGASGTLSDSIVGGTWASLNTAKAIVTGSGIVTGLSAGIDTIQYTYGTVVANKIITINAMPVAGTLSVPDSICVNNRLIVSSSISGGSWYTSNNRAVIAGNLLLAISVGIDTVCYVVANTCGTDTTKKTISVLAVPAPISGASSVCTGGTAAVSDAAPGGSWSTLYTHASVSGTGIISGDTAGSDIVIYTLPNGCSVSSSVTIVPVPTNILGADSVCSGASAMFSISTQSGIWSVSDTSKALIADTTTTSLYSEAQISLTGNGIVTILYNNICGAASKSITINSLPHPIFLADTFCLGSTVLATDSTSGGAWQADSINVAVNGTGTVTALAAGIGMVTYTNASGCSVFHSTDVLNDPMAMTGSDSTVCSGSFLYIASPSGGSNTWVSSDTSIAKVFPSASGVQVLGRGLGTVSVTFTNMCGSITKQITVNAVPAAIHPIAHLCAGATTLLIDTTAGGTWSYNTFGHITGDSIGHVTAVSAGASEAYYTLPNGCYSDVTITVDTLPGALTGSSTICEGAAILVYASEPGGTWSVSNPASATVAVVFSSDCYLLGLAAGTDTLIYTNTCGSVYKTLTVNANPAPIALPYSICTSSSVTVSDSIPSGIWSASNSNISISYSGVVVGVSTGISDITYTLPTGCYATGYISIISVPSPSAGSISGPALVCTGNYITLLDTTYSGTVTSKLWTRSNATAGIYAPYADSTPVLGVTAGLDTVFFTVSNACGSATATHIISVGTLPNPGLLSGMLSICLGAPVTLSETYSDGYWSVKNTNASITSFGAVTPNAVGTDTVVYTRYSLCGTSTAEQVLTINTIPDPGVIVGADSLCELGTDTLLATVPGGTWAVTNGNTSIGGGIVFGIAPGADTVQYAVTNMCGTGTAFKTVTVKQLADAGFITGNDTVCTSGTVTLFDSVTSGIWSITDSFATVTGGIVSGISAGTDTVKYTVGNSCGNSVAIFPVYVTTQPDVVAIAGNDTVCAGAAITLTDSTSGGHWYSSAAFSSLTVSNDSALVSGIATGVDSIAYSVANRCGTVAVSKLIQVNPIPAIGLISFSDTICKNASVIFSNSISGGTWSLADTNAYFNSDTSLVGRQLGNDTLIYTTANSCNTATTKFAFIVNTLPQPAVTGLNYVCFGTRGNYDTLTASPAGGVWTTTNGNVTCVSGVLTPVNVGFDTVIYSIANLCGTGKDSFIVKVNTAWECDSEYFAVKNVSDINNVFQVYPNPSTGYFTCKVFVETSAMISVIDVLGKKVFETVLPVGNGATALEINMSNAAKGSYIVQVATNGNTYRRQVQIW
jgi:Secretion system C-terminal sorting domain